MTPVLLNDGFNGTKALFDPSPLAVDGDLFKLRCAEPGKEYMTAWKHKDEIAQAVEDQLPHKEVLDWSSEQER